MGLFKRKPTGDDEAPRCPSCGERVPAGVRQCTMCGRSLADVPIEADSERAREAAGR